MSHEYKFFEDFTVGDTEIEATSSRTVTETDIVMHAMHSGDWMPHHVDAEWCKTQPFKKPIAHGNMSFCIGTGLIAMHSDRNPNLTSYGYNKLRYPIPVFAGDTLTAQSKVIDKRDHPEHKSHGLMTHAETVINQKGETVCYAEHVFYTKRKTPLD